MACMMTAPAFCETWSGRCTEIIDGDTIVVLKGNVAKRVRLFGIDCPETGQPFSTKATAFTTAMVHDKVVDIETAGDEKDHFKRVLAWVSVGSKSLNRALVRAGLAFWYRKYAINNYELAEIECEACRAGLGLWSQLKPPRPCSCMTNGQVGPDPSDHDFPPGAYR